MIRKWEYEKSKDPQPLKVVGLFAFVSSKKIKKRRFETKCNLRTPSDGFAEQNGRDAERAD